MVRLLNLMLYQIGWFACVLGAAYDFPWLGVALALFLVGVHLSLTNDRTRQTSLLWVAFIVGLVVDSTLLAIGVYRFPSGMIVDWLPPLWMSVLWIQFATTFQYSFFWLSKRYVLSSLLGFIGAPLAFLGGEKLGAVSFCEPRLTNLLALGSLWALAIPLLIYASDRIYRTGAIAASYRGFQRFSSNESE